MNPEFVALIALDAADRELHAADAEATALEALVTSTLAAVHTASSRREEPTAELAKNLKAQRAIDVEVHAFRERKASANRALEAALGNPDVAERQIAQSEAGISEADDRGIALLMAFDEWTLALRKADQALAAANAAVTTLNADLAKRRSKSQARIDAARALVAAARPSLPRETVLRYDSLRRRGFAVAKVHNHACSACAGHVQPQHLADLHKGRLEPCRGCGRFLAP